MIAGSAPTYSATLAPSTNQIGCTDANGNANEINACGSSSGYVYDVENRFDGDLITAGTRAPGSYGYSYAPGNKRLWRAVCCSSDYDGNTTVSTDEVVYWSVSGQKLATYQIGGYGTLVSFPPSAPPLTATQTGTWYYFGSKMIKNAGGYVVADRLGSIGHFYPYGQEKPSATTNGTEKFTAYLRDGETGMDYADQRYHVPGTGRFLTPDPYQNSAGPSDPGSWNRYAYTRGDPINRVDLTGLDDCSAYKDADFCYVVQSGSDGAGAPADDEDGIYGGGCYVDELVESPECYTPPPVQNPNPPPTTQQQPTCDQLLASLIDVYLAGYKGWTQVGSPLLAGLGPSVTGMDVGTYLVDLGEEYNVDPAFILGIGRAESSLGTAPLGSVNGGQWNVYGNSLHFWGASGGIYGNYVDPTSDVFQLIQGYISGGTTNGEAAYGKYEGRESGWKGKFKFLSNTDSALTGNINNITFNCDDARKNAIAAKLGASQ